MKSVCLYGIGSVGLRESDMPARRPGTALLKLRSVSVCGSDIKAFKGHGTKVSYPLILGHEALAQVIEIDRDNPVGLIPGDRVLIDPYLSCGECYACSLGRTNCCEHIRVLGVQTDGCMCEYFVHPDSLLHKAPEEISEELAPLAEPLTIALHALHRTGVKAGEHVAIFGAGAIGLLAAMSVIHYGGEPILLDIVQERLDFAGALGIKYRINTSTEDFIRQLALYTNGRMAEVVLEASGAMDCIHNTTAAAAYCGRIGLTGWPDGEVRLDTFSVTRKELQIYGCRNSKNEFEEAIQMIGTGAIDIRAILSEVVPFKDLPEAIERLASNPQKYIKIVGILGDGGETTAD